MLTCYTHAPRDAPAQIAKFLAPDWGEAGLDNLDSIHFDALVALARGVANPLIRLDRLDAGAAQGAGVQIDVARAGIRHHKAETLLVVEELDLAFDHGTGRRIVVAIAAPSAAAETVTATETVSAEADAAAKPITTASETVAAAKFPAWAARRGRFGRGQVDAMDVDHLQASLGIRQIANDGGALGHFAMSDRLQCGGMTESVAPIIQGDESISFGRVEPFHFARRRSPREGFGAFVVVMSHMNRRHTQAG